MKKLMYLRSGPYEPDILGYNMQEIGMLTAFCKQGYDCDLFYYGKTNRTETINIGENYGKLTIYFIKGIRLLRSGLYLRLLKKDFLSNYDVIITSEYSQIMSVLIAKLHPNVYCYNGPYYNLFKIPPLEIIYDFLFLNSLNKNVKTFFCKSSLSEKFLNDKGLRRTLTVGVGQNFDKFENVEEVSEKTKKLIEFMRKNQSLLIVGSIDDRKNFPFVLEIFSQLLNKDPNFRLVVVGTGNRNYIKKEISKFNDELVKKILFVGKITNAELQYIYPECYAFLMPSKLEIFGMVLLEAMSYRSVAISSYNGGSSTLIKDNYNGYIRSLDDSKQWSELILSKEFKINREKIINNAVETIKYDFNWEKIVNDIIENLTN